MTGDESRRARFVSGLAAPHEILLRAAGAPPLLRRRIRPLSRPVPCASFDRAWATVADEPTRRNAVVRRLERHGAGGSAGVARSGSAPAVSQRPPREGAGIDADR